jgi:ABC-type Fe3+-hydroxamate transport system substrate-binding protein
MPASPAVLPPPAVAGRARPHVLLVGAVALAAAATLAGCGSASSGGGTSATPSATVSSPATAFPVTVTGANGPVTLAKAPTTIVSLSPTATEMLYAIGAGGQVKAVDDQSTYPAQAPRTKLSGFTPSVEAVAGYQSDLVVFAGDANGLQAGLAKLGIPELSLPAAKTLDESYQQETILGQATGHPAEAAALVASVKQRIAAAVASVPRQTNPIKVYHELDPTYFSATSSTFIGSVYRLFGLTNIADSAKDAAGGYPKLSAEYVVKQAPNLIVLADTKCCQQNNSTVAKRSAFGSVPAVEQGKVLTVDDDIASRWGPRVADFAEQVAKELGGS